MTPRRPKLTRRRAGEADLVPARVLVVVEVATAIAAGTRTRTKTRTKIGRNGLGLGREIGGKGVGLAIGLEDPTVKVETTRNPRETRRVIETTERKTNRHLHPLRRNNA